ncbi:MAG: xanthine dehydrogenase family protein molybdopterin-binding subunit, partial [Pseudomonadota bacterium]
TRSTRVTSSSCKRRQVADMVERKVGSNPALLLGQGRFIEDEIRPGMLHMAVLRSPVAHGVITELDVSDAAAMPGVHAVLTADTLAAEGIGPIGLRAPLADPEAGIFNEPRRAVLAESKVAYVGHPVAAVVAETAAQAQDAVEAITLDIDALPAITDPREAEGGTEIWPEVPANTAFRWQKGNGEETDRLIAEAAHVIEAEVVHPRIAIAPVETRGALAEYSDGHYTLTTPSQGGTSLRAALANTLGIDPSALRVLTHHVGGSFAVKIWPYPEHVLVLLAARLTGRPVRWISSRSEAFLSDVPGRARVDRGTLALDAEGRMLAFRIEADADLGAFLNPAAPSIVTTGAVRPFGQVYDIPGQHYRVAARLTTAPPTDAYRGAGKPESTLTLERLIDLAAGELGLDKAEIRRRNLITPARLPVATPMGETMDSGDFPAMLDAALAAADWVGTTERKQVARAQGLRRGASVGFQLHATGGAVSEVSSVRALTDGTVEVWSGSQDSGQSHQETLAKITAEALDLDPGRIRVRQGDTGQEGIAGATGGSNLLPVTAPTVHRAAKAMLDRAREAASNLLEAAEADLDYGGGTFRIIGTDRTVSLAMVAADMEARDDDCMAQLAFEGDHTTWPNGASICEVELDPETGHVRVDRLVTVNDLGRIILEHAAHGQILGGIAQGVGEALMEGFVFDLSGQPVTGSFMDYGIPRADDLPFVDVHWRQTESPTNLLGTKGVGELASIGIPGLVVNAVMDALSEVGVHHLQRPLTPVKIWSALAGSGASRGC